MKRGKRIELDSILSLIKSGKSPACISKEFNIPKGSLAYHVDKLKKLGCIEKKGYGVWKYIKSLKEVRSLTITHSDKLSRTSHKKEIRGHAFIWKIQFYNPYVWEKIVNSYKKKRLTFQFMKHNKQFRTIVNNRKIWLGRRGMTIYEPIDFMGRSSFEVKGKAVFEMDKLIKHLIKELGQKMRPYRFTTSREHYGIIKNELARQYNDQKKKMEIRTEDGNVWMWIDDSKGLGELENNEPNVNRQVQNFWNNHKKNNFKIDADYTKKGFNKVNKEVANLKGVFPAMKEYNKNLKLHTKVQESQLKTQKETQRILKLIGEALDKKL